MKKERYSNFELLRIISMCGIIMLHYFNSSYGGMIQNAQFPDFSWIFSNFIDSFCIPLVNCFVIISGFFLVSKDEFGLRKPVNLLFVTAFYGIIAFFIGVVFGNTKFTLYNLLVSIFPFFAGYRWFVETYLILILFSPFINIILNSLNKRNFRILLAIQIFIFSVWYSIGLSAPLLDNGYGIINFITLYLIGAYLRLFVFERIKEQKQNKWGYLYIYIFVSILTFILSYFMNPFGYAFITNIVAAVAIFSFFCCVDMGSRSIINKISNCAFDVYFIHSDINTSNLLIGRLLHGHLFINSPLMIFHMIFTVIIVWVIGYIACTLRTKLFKVSLEPILDRVLILNRVIDLKVK